MNCKIQKWKEKAISRRIEICAKNKRIKELTQSRDSWKSKYKAQQAAYKTLLKANRIGSQPSISTQVKHHSYSSEFINLCLNLRTMGNCSLRGCLKVLQVLSMVLELELTCPSPSSIRNWELKMGYEKIHRRCIEEASNWMLIIDESVSVGSQKILLLLGVNLDRYDFTTPLQMSDVETLSIAIKKSWKAPAIDIVIKQLYERRYSFKYCCCDNGNNLRKVLKLNNLIHIEDCGHCLGKILEKKYKKDSKYKDFCAEKSLFQKRNLLSQHAAFLPPKQRTKGRYMNLGSTVKWAKKVLIVAKSYEQQSTPPSAYEQIKWLLAYEDFILQLDKEQSLIDQTNKILKHQGLSQQAIIAIEKEIEKSDVEDDFSEQIKAYLNRNLDKLPDENKLICSSDIIESIFGKFKNSLGDNSMAGLTQGSLSIANYGEKFSSTKVKKVLEEVKIVDIKKWREENLPISLQQKRARLFKNTG